jgi:hypothetical protein
MDKHTQEREIVLLTDVELDAVAGGDAAGGKVTPQDIHFVKNTNTASAKLL